MVISWLVNPSRRLAPALLVALATSPSGATEPVIDVHLHALSASAQGPPPLGMCSPMPFPTWSQLQPYGQEFLALFKQPPCPDPIWSPETDEALMAETLTAVRESKVYGILSGPAERVTAWRRAEPGRFWAGLTFSVADDPPSPEALRDMVRRGDLEVLGEITNQYAGVAPDDPRMEPYWALAEELDIPVGIHVGPGPPGAVYLGDSSYRARLHSALTLEDVLVRHPRLRLYVMHAGFPMLDDMLAVLYAHPQVHVGTGVIVYTQPRETFYRYLRGLVEAGFGDRVMFGSDQMVWPGAIARSIGVIRDAPFLSPEQKRAILYENAARFLRLDEATRRRHHEETRTP